MAEFDFTCPFCGESFTCADTMKGMNVSCPGCDEQVCLIPDDEVEEENPEVGLPPPPPVMAKTASQTTEIQVICPHCQQQLLCDFSMRGEYISCPSCGNEVLVQARVVKVSRSGNAPQSHAQMPSYYQDDPRGGYDRPMNPPPMNADHYNHGYGCNPVRRKSRLVFILFGIFLGVLGIHNFYAGYTDEGKSILITSLLMNIIGVVLEIFLPEWLSWYDCYYALLVLRIVWGIVMLFLVIRVIINLVQKDCDANGVPMSSW